MVPNANQHFLVRQTPPKRESWAILINKYPRSRKMEMRNVNVGHGWLLQHQHLNTDI